MATGTLALAGQQNFPKGEDKAYILDWTCDAEGDVDQSISDLIGAVGGRIIAVETVPGLNGDLLTSLPTNLYDIDIQDEYNTDVMAAALDNRSGTVGERVNPSPGIPVWSPLTLIVSDAGISLSGRIIIVISTDGD